MVRIGVPHPVSASLLTAAAAGGGGGGDGVALVILITPLANRLTECGPAAANSPCLP